MSPEEREAVKIRREAVLQAREIERQKVEAAVRAKAARLWDLGRDVQADHPYIIKKGIIPKGIRQLKDMLLITMSETGTGTPASLQLIFPDGSKRFLTGVGAIKETLYHVIKKGTGGSNLLYVTEGYATGISVNAATGISVVVAFSSGRLAAVAQALRDRFPTREIVIAGDCGNGSGKAVEAARLINDKVAIPTMPEGITGSDWNDLYTGVSPEEVARQLATAAAPVDPTPDTGTAAVSPTDTWREPLPLPEGLPPVKSLEPEMIPAPLRGWLMDIADRMQIPPDFSTAAAVVALGSVIGRACGIHPKRRDDWLVVPNLFGMVVGRPSLLKTPAVTEAQRHLVRLETEARNGYQSAADASGIDAEIEKITRAAICEEIKKAVKSSDTATVARKRAELQNMNNDAAPITRRRYQTQDGTTEKIGEILIENPRGILINRDELVGWFHALDKPGREGDRAFYLEAWNGTRGYTYDRIGRGTLDIDALCLSIFGAITPGPLSDYVYQAARGGNGDDGLLQRFQVMVWPDTPDEWRNVDRFPDTTEKNRAWEIFKALSGGIPGAIKEEGADIPALRFTPAGQDIFDTWRHELETRLRSDHGLAPSLESHLAKYRSLMPSLALIFHLVDVVNGSATGAVSEQAALMAAAWCQYLESHAGRVYGGAMIPGMESAKEIVKHIKRGAIKDGCRTWEIWRPQWSRLTTPEEAKAGLEILTQYDWLTVTKTFTGGRPSEIITMNPAIKL